MYIMKIYFYNREFDTKKEFQIYIKDLVKNKIGICNSVKSTKYWSEIYELMKRHTEFQEKTKNLKDVIVRKSLYGNIELAIINNDNSITSFSYIHCIKGLPGTKLFELSSAMRESILEQIFDYKNNNNLECNYCKSKDNIEIDHIIPFSKLRDDFITICNDDKIPIPSSFNRTDNIRRQFKEEDLEFYSNWLSYHELNCKLQPLCRNCNIKKSNKMI